jgi:2-dehydropantoate 2-reductase
MRILVIGAGALGRYFGGRLLRAARDVRFLVRGRRSEQLASNGLSIFSPHGDFTVQAPTLLADAVREPFDVVLVAVKSYSLNEAMDQFAPAVGPGTAILPLINGVSHIEALSARFGADRVLGGMAIITATLDAEGRVIQLLPNHDLVFGELSGGFTGRMAALSKVLGGAGFNARASETVIQDMWEKWAALATNAGITCLMRASIGDIIAAPGGDTAIMALFNECRAVASASGFAPRPPSVQFWTSVFATPGSPLKASMLRDIERGAPTEGEHVLGDLLKRAQALGVETPVLALARSHVGAYEVARARSLSHEA